MPNIKKQCDKKFYKGPHNMTTYSKLKFEVFDLFSFKCITDIHYFISPVFSQKTGTLLGPVLKKFHHSQVTARHEDLSLQFYQQRTFSSRMRFLRPEYFFSRR
jgi:hypothetical protein